KPLNNNEASSNSYEQTPNDYTESSSNFQKQAMVNNNYKQTQKNSATSSRRSVFAPFRSPFKDSSKLNLPSHSRQTHSEPPNSGLKTLHAEPSHSEPEALKKNYNQ
ncbi:12514_t:CDS:1, partial [Dentiscutata heterogama]